MPDFIPANIPPTISYKFNTRDGEDAQKNKPQITPYGVHPSFIPSSQSMAGGTMVTMSTAQARKLHGFSRFEIAGKGWVPVPAAAQGAATLADLCRKLHALSPAMFPAADYDLDKMSLSERNRTALLLFDYWGNTEYRFAVTTSGRFDWSSLDPKNDILKGIPTKATSSFGEEAKKGEQRIRYVLALAPTVTTIAAKPAATQVVQPPDPVLTKLDADISEIARLVRRIQDLMQQAKEQLQERVWVAQRATALRVMLEECAASKSDGERAARRAREAKAVEEIIHKGVKGHKAWELVNNHRVDRKLRETVQKELAFSTDIASDIAKLSEELAKKLLDDAGAAQRASDFAAGIIEKKLIDKEPFLQKQAKMIATLVEAAMVLHETKLRPQYLEKLFDIIKKVPKNPVLNVSEGDYSTFLSGVWTVIGSYQLIGLVSSATTTLVGNVAGPPSLWIAWVQLGVWNRFLAGMKAAKGLDPAAAASMLESTLQDFERGLRPDSTLRANLRAAVKANDKESFKLVARDVLDESTSRIQTSPLQKAGVVLVQIVSLLVALSSTRQDIRDDKSGVVIVVDTLNLWSQLANLAVGVADVAVTVSLTKASEAGKVKLPWSRVERSVSEVEDIAAKISRCGMWMGMLSSFVGIVTGGMQTAEAWQHKNHLGVAVGSTGALGSLASLFYCACWLSGNPLPGLQLAGLSLAAVSMGLTLLQLILENAEPGPNRVARALLDSIQNSVFYGILILDGDFELKFQELREKLTYRVGQEHTGLPLAPNNDFVRTALFDAGFRQEIKLIVDPTMAPVLPTGILPETN